MTRIISTHWQLCAKILNLYPFEFQLCTFENVSFYSLIFSRYKTQPDHSITNFPKIYLQPTEIFQDYAIRWCVWLACSVFFEQAWHAHCSTHLCIFLFCCKYFSLFCYFIHLFWCWIEPPSRTRRQVRWRDAQPHWVKLQLLRAWSGEWAYCDGYCSGRLVFTGFTALHQHPSCWFCLRWQVSVSTIHQTCYLSYCSSRKGGCSDPFSKSHQLRVVPLEPVLMTTGNLIAGLDLGQRMSCSVVLTVKRSVLWALVVGIEEEFGDERAAFVVGGFVHFHGLSPFDTERHSRDWTVDNCLALLTGEEVHVERASRVQVHKCWCLQDWRETGQKTCSCPLSKLVHTNSAAIDSPIFALSRRWLAKIMVPLQHTRPFLTLMTSQQQNLRKRNVSLKPGACTGVKDESRRLLFDLWAWDARKFVDCQAQCKSEYWWPGRANISLWQTPTLIGREAPTTFRKEAQNPCCKEIRIFAAHICSQMKVTKKSLNGHYLSLACRLILWIDSACQDWGINGKFHKLQKQLVQPGKSFGGGVILTMDCLLLCWVSFVERLSKSQYEKIWKAASHAPLFKWLLCFETVTTTANFVHGRMCLWEIRKIFEHRGVRVSCVLFFLGNVSSKRRLAASLVWSFSLNASETLTGVPGSIFSLTVGQSKYLLHRYLVIKYIRLPWDSTFRSQTKLLEGNWSKEWRKAKQWTVQFCAWDSI